MLYLLIESSSSYSKKKKNVDRAEVEEEEEVVVLPGQQSRSWLCALCSVLGSVLHFCSETEIASSLGRN